MAEADTIAGIFLNRVEELGDRPALLERQDRIWVSQSWREWGNRARAVAAALVEEGVEPQECAAIYSYSRRQWVEADLGVMMAGARTVTVYHNLNAETVRYILDDAGAKVVFAEGPIQLQSLFDAAMGGLPASVRRVVYFDERQTPLPRPGRPQPDEISVEQVVPEDARSTLVSFEQFIAAGKRALDREPRMLEARIAALKPEEIAKVVYTSGTTGTPKGAMLSHKNFLFTVDSVQKGLNLRPSDTTLLFLPLAHVYAQLVYHAAIKIGFSIAFAKSMLTAVDDAASVKPDFFTTVPRLFEKIHSGALAKVEEEGGIKKSIFHWALRVGSAVSAAKQKGEKTGAFLGLEHAIANRLVFSKLKARLGGRLRFMISGGAPLSSHILEFFHAADLLILEGYGMTENASLSHYNPIDRYKFGTVGLPIPGVEVRTADDGEILIRGPNVMKGYLGKPAETSEAIDSDGWLHTGDIGSIDDNGFLRITDRKKELIVTSGGKNVAPAPIESALSKSRFVSQALVFGEGRKYLVALFTLDRDHVARWARERGIDITDWDQVVGNRELLNEIQKTVDGVNAHLDPYSTIKSFAVLNRDFSISDGEMTPSLKLRRKVIEQRCLDLLDSLYSPNRC